MTLAWERGGGRGRRRKGIEGKGGEERWREREGKEKRRTMTLCLCVLLSMLCTSILVLGNNIDNAIYQHSVISIQTASIDRPNPDPLVTKRVNVHKY